jgi:hypothetical protein
LGSVSLRDSTAAKSINHHRKEKPVSFWDEHPDTGGGGYLTPDEKDELVKSETPFEITAVRFEEENKYGPRYVVTLNLPDPTTGDNETKMVGFPKGSGVTSRDDLLQAMMDDYFGAGETEPLRTVLAKGGNSFLLKPAPGEVTESK